MDVALSLVSGFGLRVYVVRMTSPTSFIAPAVLGLWEGVLVHQLSFHPPPSMSSSPLDHYLALGLRLVMDFLVAGNWSKGTLVGVCAVIGTIISESMFPSFSSSFNSSVRRSSSHRTREKRYRHSRAAPSHVPSHIRVYKEPDTSPPPLPVRVPKPQTSTPILPTIQVDPGLSQPSGQELMSPNLPPTPPSFFLHTEMEPSPFPDSPASPPKPTTSTIVSQIPSRPTSALAFYEGENAPPPDPSVRPLPPSNLPTPPDSTFRERTMDSRVDRLSTIDEITSRSEHVSEGVEQGKVEGEENYILVSHGGGPPLPIPNATSHYIHADEGTPIASAVPLPIPPVPYRNPAETPIDDGSDELRTPSQPLYDVGPDSDLDELRTPPVLQARISHSVTVAPSPGDANDRIRQDNGLSPLVLDSRSIALEQELIQVPGTTLSNYAILQAPVPLGPVLDIVSGATRDAIDSLERPISPSTGSEAESVLSTRIPVEVLEHAEDSRKKAVQAKQELAWLRHELKRAESERRAKDALFLRGDIRETEKWIDKLNERARKRFLTGHNNLQKPDTIDVHGLRPEEALEATEEKLREQLKSGQSTLIVIVGKGLHSKDGIPVVKNHIIAAMQSRLIPCKVDPFNAGKLILTLPTTNP